MEMPDKIYATKGITNRFDGVWDDYQWADQSGTEYHHNRILKAKDAEIAELRARLEINASHPYDGIYTRNETIKMLEKRIAELESMLEARGFDKL